MLGKIIVGLIVVDIVLLYTFAFASKWMLGVLGGDWMAILFAAAIGCPVVALGIGSICPPVHIRNSKQLARDIADELKQEGKGED